MASTTHQVRSLRPSLKALSRRSADVSPSIPIPRVQGAANIIKRTLRRNEGRVTPAGLCEHPISSTPHSKVTSNFYGSFLVFSLRNGSTLSAGTLNRGAPARMASATKLGAKWA